MQVSLSSELMPMVKAVPRGLTACADAYLTPSIAAYLTAFRSGFDTGLQACTMLYSCTVVYSYHIISYIALYN